MDSKGKPDRHMERDRNERGRFEEEYNSEDFLSAVQEHEPATTTEVADTVGCVRQNADYRLRRLKGEGLVQSKKVGPSLVWTVRTFNCERCGEELPRADMELVPIVSAMDSVGLHEEAPVSDDGSVHELCSDCAEEWYSRTDSGSFNSFLEEGDQ